MKKLGLLAILAATLLSLSPLSASALESNQNGVVNKTGMAIEQFYISPSNQESWGSDILQGGVLANGASGIINFHPDDNNCVFDVKIVDENGKAWIVQGVDLCKHDNLIFGEKDGQVVYMAD